MAYGVVSMRKIQLGQESDSAGTSVPGTPVAATAIWRGPGAQIDSGKVIAHPSENVGVLFDTDRVYTPTQLATIDFPQTEATYEQILYPLTAGIKDVMSGSSDSSGTGKIYSFTWDEAGTNVVKSYTIEAGDNNAVSEMEYSVCTEFTLTWAAQQGLMVASKWIGRQRTTGVSFTGSLSLPTVEEILTPKIYIDAVAGTIGGTPITGTLIGYELAVTTGIQPIFSADGNIYFASIKYVKPTVTLRLTYEHDSNASTEYAAFVAGTPRCVRILHEGSALQTPGDYSKKTFLVDMVGTYSSFPPYTDQDGDNIITAELMAGYDATEDLFARFLVVNNLTVVT